GSRLLSGPFGRRIQRPAEVVFVGQTVQIGAAIRDGQETPAHRANTRLGEPVMKIEKLRKRLDRLAGLTGYYKQGMGEVNRALHFQDRRRIRGVQHEEAPSGRRREY